MQKELIVSEIGMTQIVTGIILVIGLIICIIALKRSLSHLPESHREIEDTKPTHWLE